MDIRGSRLLLTGGASMIGFATTELLLAAGAERVVLFDNLSFDAPDEALRKLFEHPRVELVRGDVRDGSALTAACRNIDGVYALAGFMSAGIAKDPATALAVNVDGVRNVLEACCTNRVRRLVFASSVAVYGYGAIAGAVDESVPFHSAGVPAPPLLYGATKILGEQLCHLYLHRGGPTFVALRYSTVYGERQHYRSTNALYIVEALDRVERGLPPILPGDGSETKDFVHVSDVARANVLAMQSDVSGDAFNISGGKPLSVRFLAETVIRLVGAKLEPVYQDAPSGEFRIRVDAPFHYDNAAARSQLGWEPEVDIEQGITRLIEYRRRKSETPVA